MRVALITAVYDAYDPLKDLPADHGFDEAICVTDGNSPVGAGWKIIVAPSDSHPRLAAKRPKMMPWLYTDCDAAVWLDASFSVKSAEFSRWSRQLLSISDFVVWPHPENRYCITQEGPVCWDWEKYKDWDIRGQLQHYLDDGMPPDWGLFACGTVGYRFTDEVKAFGEEWYGEQSKWSIQDQISLPYLLWKNGKRFGLWPANEYNNDFVELHWGDRPNPSK